MDGDNIKILDWIICDNGTYVDEEEQMRRYELVAKDLGNDKDGGPYESSEVYIMRITADHLPLWDFQESEFFGQPLVWKCNMDLFETRQEMITHIDLVKEGMANVYYPKQGVKLSDILVFDIQSPTI